jgi:hypothetical protein
MTSVFKNACVKIRTVPPKKRTAKNVFFEDQRQQNINFAKKIQNVPFKAILLERKNRDRNVCYSTSNKHSFSFGITPRIRIFTLLRYRYRYCIMNTNSLPRRGSLSKLESIFWWSRLTPDTNRGEFFYFCFMYGTALYSTQLHLPPLRFHCVGGCWDRTMNTRHSPC